MNEHLKSDYIYKVTQHVIGIKDLNKGRMSVTNNIESIVENIALVNQINPLDYTIVYMDSENQIDEFRWSDKSFHAIPSRVKIKALTLLP